MCFNRTGIVISSVMVGSCRGNSLRVAELMQMLRMLMDMWILEYGVDCDSAAVRDMLDRSIRPGTFQAVPTLVRVVHIGKSRRIKDLLLWAMAQPDPARALCGYVRLRTKECCREERIKGRRRGAQLDDEDPPVPGEGFFTLADRERLVEALARLPKDEMIAIQDYYYHEMPKVAIARHLKTTPRKVTRLLRSGQTRLREMLLQGE